MKIRRIDCNIENYYYFYTQFYEKRKLFIVKSEWGGVYDLALLFENINLKVNTILYEKMV